jgi:hypothetical protein
MAKKQEMEIVIAHDGTVTIDVYGIKGSSCLDLTKGIEESLGIMLNREKKSSFYEQEDFNRVNIKGENE